MRSLIRSLRVTLVPAVSAAIVVSGCQTREPTEPTVSDVLLKPGGGGGKGPKVDSTDPPGAEQDTTLDVRVLGSGFDEGSNVNYLLNEQPVATVQTNSVTFVSSKELRTNITIALEAVPDLYDVEVVTSRGKRGIGADLFQVVQKGGPPPEKTPVSATYRDDPLDGMVSDGGGPYDAEVNGTFGMDARAQTNTRKLCFNFHEQLTPAEVGFSDQPDADVLCDDGSLTTGFPLQQDNQTEGVAFTEMAVGAVQRARLGGFYVREGFNWSFKWGKDCDFNEIPAERATIVRVSDTQWTIEATTMRLCKSRLKGSPKNDGPVPESGDPLNMPVQLTLNSQ